MNIAIITGASSGLGVEYLKTIVSQEGQLDEIWLIARREERLQALAEQYKGVPIRPVALDLSKNEAYFALDEMLKQKNPSVRILINNAGYEKTGRFDEMPQDAILSMVELNVKGLTMLNRICFPYMEKGAVAILTCSVSSFCPVPAQAVYSASKAYVRSLGRSLHYEMKKKGVKVLTMCPGNMNTEMNPQGQGSQSGIVDRLPFLDMKHITAQALEKANAGKAIYTPGLFYKCYRLLCKLLPSAWMIKIVGKSYSDEVSV